ncbi:MAG TPA: choice-of-anchor tandem repeat GloVer-containing protein [Candidatus Saccharimonadales bacterium]|nr:choice-of-anchor tandem repeat GloVer-containing protein [Candidatus Saccharimonadales bacterium]
MSRFKNRINHLLRLVLLALATCSSHLSTAAPTNQVGLLTINYTMNANSSGQWFEGVAVQVGGGVSGNDGVTVSISGQIQFPVFQSGTNLIFGTNPTNSSAQQTVSGNWAEESWAPDGDIGESFDSLASPIVGWNGFEATNTCVTLIQTNNSGQGTADCEQALFSWSPQETPPYYPEEDNGLAEGGYISSGSLGDQSLWPLDVDSYMVGEICLVYAMDVVDTLAFALPNAALPWSQTLSSNVTVNVSTNYVFANDFLETISGTATANNTITFQYVTYAPTVSFTAAPTNGLVPLPVQFSSPAKDSLTNALVSWNWNFGDGSSNTVRNPSHTYTNNGTFTVTLTTTNVNGTTVLGVPVNIVVALPTAQFTAFPTNGIVPLGVNFAGPSVDSANNEITNWSWRFGDGFTSAFQDPAHTYAPLKSKTNSPSLTVININGTAIVAAGPQIAVLYPPVDFSASPASGQVPLTVQFSAPTNDALGYPITNWNWRFDDGSTGAGQNPSHTYAISGVYSASLTAKNTNGAIILGFGPNIAAGCSEVYAFGVTSSSGFDPIIEAITNSDGIHPQAGLALSSNRLYGVMSGGGNGGSGTIFAVNTDGSAFTNLYNFSAVPMVAFNNADGANPRSTLVLAGGALYGTASQDGVGGGGTVFAINSDRSGFTNLYNFTNFSTNGFDPNGLVLSGETLYGTTYYGGGANGGTVFAVNTNGSGFTNLYSFSAGGYNASFAFTNGDGAYPAASLVVSGNTLYGTASQGGSFGNGTVFRVNTDGSAFTNLYTFTNNDGASPQAGLVLSGNTLYGVARQGGTYGSGTVFQVNTDGSNYATLYNFSNGATNNDGALPAGLLLTGGLLYGTTQGGGSGGSGTIFAVNTDGSAFTNLYGFSALESNTNLDGANPEDGVVMSGGTLFTTTFAGGSAGDGAVFSLSLGMAPPTLAIESSGNAVVISWPLSVTGWILQTNNNLVTGSWGNYAGAITNNSLTNSPPKGSLFFRLANP